MINNYTNGSKIVMLYLIYWVNLNTQKDLCDLIKTNVRESHFVNVIALLL